MSAFRSDTRSTQNESISELPPELRNERARQDLLRETDTTPFTKTTRLRNRAEKEQLL